MMHDTNKDAHKNTGADLTTEPWEKKSERFEVRLPFSKKQAFVQACENQGDTPSEAIRRFIHTYLRRAEQDDAGMARRTFRQRTRQNLTFGLTGVIAIAAVALFGPQSCASLKAQNYESKRQALFATYDADGDGELKLGEISANDKGLHDVLDIDDSQTISLSEFFIKGRMQLVTSFEGKADVQGNIIASRKLIEFDLSDANKIILNKWRVDPDSKSVNDKMDRMVFRHYETGEFTGFLSNANLSFEGDKLESMTFNFKNSQITGLNRDVEPEVTLKGGPNIDVDSGGSVVIQADEVTTNNKD